MQRLRKAEPALDAEASTAQVLGGHMDAAMTEANQQATKIKQGAKSTGASSGLRQESSVQKGTREECHVSQAFLLTESEGQCI